MEKEKYVDASKFALLWVTWVVNSPQQHVSITCSMQLKYARGGISHQNLSFSCILYSVTYVKPQAWAVAESVVSFHKLVECL